MSNKNWSIDPSHSEIKFGVKHLMITNVTGKFGAFNAEVVSEKEDFSDAKISFSAEIDSISTGNEQRDGHLKSADFFDAAVYPELKFNSTSFRKLSGNDYELIGALTIKDVTQEVTLKTEFSGVVVDPYGNTKAGFSVSGKISRKSFGLLWNAVTESGGIVVSDEVKLFAEIQLIAEVVAVS
jgi:polyisoprenoid-binding protein YceI